MPVGLGEVSITFCGVVLAGSCGIGDGDRPILLMPAFSGGTGLCGTLGTLLVDTPINQLLTRILLSKYCRIHKRYHMNARCLFGSNIV